MKKQFNFLTAISLVGFIILAIMINLKPRPDLNRDLSKGIYTLENIYYLRGTRVYSENEETRNFATREDAEAYLSMRTVIDNQAGYDCLNPDYPEDCEPLTAKK